MTNKGNKSKRIGTRFEMDVVKLAREFGLEAKRAWGSNGNAAGWHAEVDLMIEGYRFQAKKRNKLADFLQPSEHVDGVVFKQTRGQTLVLFPMEAFLKILKRKEAKPGSDLNSSLRYTKEEWSNKIRPVKEALDELVGEFFKDEDNEKG